MALLLATGQLVDQHANALGVDANAVGVAAFRHALRPGNTQSCLDWLMRFSLCT